MKKIVISVVTVCLSMLVLAQAPTKDPKAKAILDQVSAYYKNIDSFKATFEFTIRTSQAEMNKQLNGYIIYKKGKFIVDKGDGSTIYTDGVTLWDYYHADGANEVTINNYDEKEMSQMSIQSVVDMYKSGYKYILKGESKVNDVLCNEIDLDPELSPEEHARNQVFKIRLFINKATNKLERWQIFQKNGDRYAITIKSFDTKYVAQDAAFTFDKSKHPGVIVEDWR